MIGSYIPEKSHLPWENDEPWHKRDGQWRLQISPYSCSSFQRGNSIASAGHFFVCIREKPPPRCRILKLAHRKSGIDLIPLSSKFSTFSVLNFRFYDFFFFFSRWLICEYFTLISMHWFLLRYSKNSLLMRNFCRSAKRSFQSKWIYFF